MRSAHALADYMPSLAVVVARCLGEPPQSMLVADFLVGTAKREDVFPAGLSKSGRGMRLQRLLDAPVQVGSAVLTMENRPKRHTYDKTRRLVLVHGVLPDEPPVFANGARPVDPRDLRFASYAPVTPGPLPPAEHRTAAFVTREDFDARMSTIEALLRQLAPGPQPLGSLPAFHPSNPQSHVAAAPYAPPPFARPVESVADLVRRRVGEIEAAWAELARGLGLAEPAAGGMREPGTAADADARLTRAAFGATEILAAVATDPAWQTCEVPRELTAPTSDWEVLRDRCMRVGVLHNRVKLSTGAHRPVPAEPEGD